MNDRRADNFNPDNDLGNGDLGGADPRLEVEAYLDGQLAGERLGFFERRLQAEPALAAELRLQRRIDESITRCFIVPPTVAAGAVIDRLVGASRVNGHDVAGATSDSSTGALRADQSPRLSRGLSGLSELSEPSRRRVLISRP